MVLAREMALCALLKVGDANLGEWHEIGDAYHIRRRLTGDEMRLAGGLTVRDIRGTEEERRRLAALFREYPALRRVFPWQQS